MQAIIYDTKQSIFSMTLKQLQAFLWVTRMGTFAAAAKRLHTTQSTISARIMELEASLGVRVFDRAGFAARLTVKGRELLPLAERLLNIESQIESTVGDPSSLSGVVKVGVAEFVALSWLPNWVASANRRFPNVVLEIDVDLTLALQQKLADGALDLAFLPGPTPDPSLVQKDLGAVTFCWMASPVLGVPSKVLDAKELEPFPIILLSSHSNLHAILRNWFELAAASPRRVDLCNSLATIASLTIAGLGISFLPLNYHRADIRSRKLKVVQTRPSIPPLTYVAAYRVDRPNSLVGPLSDLAASLSTFEGKTEVGADFARRAKRAGSTSHKSST